MVGRLDQDRLWVMGDGWEGSHHVPRHVRDGGDVFKQCGTKNIVNE